MSNFNELVQETGFTTKKGEELFNSQLVPAINEILSVAMSENEVRVLQSLISNRIGKLALDRIVDVNSFTNDQLLEEKSNDTLPDSFVDPNAKPEDIRKAMGLEKSFEVASKNVWIDPFEIIFDDTE